MGFSEIRIMCTVSTILMFLPFYSIKKIKVWGEEKESEYKNKLS